MGMLQKLFSPQEMKNILKIPLSLNGGHDKIIWKEMPSGEFTVRSAYVVAKRIEGREIIDRNHRNQIWKKIGAAQVAPKVRHFMWRAVHNICPTSENLHRRGMNELHGCPICHSKTEDLLNTLFFCPLSTTVWSNLCPAAIPRPNTMEQHEQFWSIWIEEMSRGKILDLCMVVCWNLWKNRNKALHEGQTATPSALIKSAQSYYTSYVEANTQAVSSSTTTETVAWQAPRSGWIKVNVDAAYSPTSNHSQVAAVARTNEGQVIFSVAQKIAYVASATAAELLAILLGIKISIPRTTLSIIVETDSMHSILEIQRGKSSFSPWAALVSDIHNENRLLPICAIQHTKRTPNVMAHDLAHLPIEGNQVHVWDSYPIQM